MASSLLDAPRRRLTRFYLLVLVAVIVLYGIGAFALVAFTMFKGLDQVNARMLAPVVSAFINEDESLSEVIHELSEVAIGEREHLALLTRKGQVLYARGLILDPEPPLQAGSFTAKGPDPMRILVLPLVREGETVGYLRVGQSLVGPRQALGNLAMGLAAAAPVAIGLAGLAGNWLARRALDPVSQAFERERQFTRDASHELRTPLSVVLAHVQLALAAPELTEATREKLQVVERSARRMAALVGDLLTLGRADVGLHEAGMRFSLEELVEEEVEALLPLAKERGMAFAFAPGPHGAQVRGEPARLAQAVRNLLDNALRYADPRSRIDVRVSESGGRLAVTVSHPAPEMPAADQARIFERFVRLPESRQRNPEGSGLGLAIARAVARAHGGDLKLESQAGRIAFTLSLPKA